MRWNPSLPWVGQHVDLPDPDSVDPDAWPGDDYLITATEAALRLGMTRLHIQHLSSAFFTRFNFESFLPRGESLYSSLEIERFRERLGLPENPLGGWKTVQTADPCLEELRAFRDRIRAFADAVNPNLVGSEAVLNDGHADELLYALSPLLVQLVYVQRNVELDLGLSADVVRVVRDLDFVQDQLSRAFYEINDRWDLTNAFDATQQMLAALESLLAETPRPSDESISEGRANN